MDDGTGRRIVILRRVELGAGSAGWLGLKMGGSKSYFTSLSTSPQDVIFRSIDHKPYFLRRFYGQKDHWHLPMRSCGGHDQQRLPA